MREAFQMWWRWTLLLTSLIAAFWGIWYLIAGSVPYIGYIKITDYFVWDLGVARPWLDLLAIPFWVACGIGVHWFLRRIDEKGKQPRFRLIGWVVCGTELSLIFSFSFSLVAGLAVGLMIGLMIEAVVILTPLLGSGINYLVRFLLESCVCHWLTAKKSEA